ncbi:MAG: tetratricopeptide repeat protein [Bacteroidetes bacterium]|nr:tetratricopeptide repeat protein [Bacteroidota bacterium]
MKKVFGIYFYSFYSCLPLRLACAAGRQFLFNIKYFPVLHFIILYSLSGVHYSLGQNSITDSLSARLQMNINDTDRVNTMLDLAWEISFSNPDTALTLSMNTLTLLKSDGNFTSEWKAIAFGKTYHRIGSFYNIKGNYRLALDYFAKALYIWSKLEPKVSEYPASLILSYKATTLVNTGNAFNELGDYAKALNLYKRALKIDELLGDKRGISADINNIGLVYSRQGNYPDALDCFYRALKIDAELGDKDGMTYDMGNIGIVLSEKGDYPKSLRYFLGALKLNGETNNKYYLAALYSNIGVIYVNQSEYLKALDFFSKAWKIDEELGNNFGIARHMGNIGNIYRTMPDTCYSALGLNKADRYAKTLDNYRKALQMDIENGNREGVARHLDNIGNTFMNLAERNAKVSEAKQLLDTALKYYFKAMKTDHEIGNRDGIARHLGNIGSVYMRIGNFTEAEKYLFSAKSLADSIGAINILMKIAYLMSDLYDTTGNFKLSLVHYKRYSFLKDSLFNESKSKEIGKLEAKYEYDKQQAVAEAEHKKEIELAGEREKRQRIFIYLIAAVAVAVTVIAFIIFRSLKITRRQKSIIEGQKKLVEQKQEEILASIRYARRIQNAMLPTEKYLERIFKKTMKNT